MGTSADQLAQTYGEVAYRDQFPEPMSEDWPSTRARQQPYSLRKLTVLFVLIAIAPDLVPLTFGPQWVPAIPVVQILAVFFMSRGLQTWNTSVMDAAGKPHVDMILNAMVLIALPPSIWLGSEFGVAGVAGGSCSRLVGSESSLELRSHSPLEPSSTYRP